MERRRPLAVLGGNRVRAVRDEVAQEAQVIVAVPPRRRGEKSLECRQLQPPQAALRLHDGSRAGGVASGGSAGASKDASSTESGSREGLSSSSSSQSARSNPRGSTILAAASSRLSRRSSSQL